MPADAAWAEPKEIIAGTWGKGAGQLGLRSEGGYDVLPKIEAVTADKHIIISDPVNRKQLLFNSTNGKFLSEMKWDDKQGQIGKAVAPLSDRARMAQIVRSLRIGSDKYRITIVFSDRNVEVDSDDAFSHAVRDDAGTIYGISAEQVSRLTGMAGRRHPLYSRAPMRSSRRHREERPRAAWSRIEGEVEHARSRSDRQEA